MKNGGQAVTLKLEEKDVGVRGINRLGGWCSGI